MRRNSYLNIVTPSTSRKGSFLADFQMRQSHGQDSGGSDVSITGSGHNSSINGSSGMGAMLDGVDAEHVAALALASDDGSLDNDNNNHTSPQIQTLTETQTHHSHNASSTMVMPASPEGNHSLALPQLAAIAVATGQQTQTKPQSPSTTYTSHSLPTTPRGTKSVDSGQGGGNKAIKAFSSMHMQGVPRIGSFSISMPCSPVSGNSPVATPHPSRPSSPGPYSIAGGCSSVVLEGTEASLTTDTNTYTLPPM
jgi:hypothetical protein